MAVPPVLIVSLVFDPPVIAFFGPIQETTIKRLNGQLPFLTYNAGSRRKNQPVFEFNAQPAPHWTLELRGQTTDVPSQMAIEIAILDALEEEGGWGLHDCHAVTMDFEESHKLFFVKKSR
jgi:hypothetical protein